jgi:HlyD family secretion protein
MKRRTPVIATLAVVVLASAGGIAVRGNGKEPAVRTVAVQRGDIVDRALAVGTIEPRTEISVKSKVSGVVQRLFAEPGDYVRAGARLMELRPDPTPLELVEARRALELREIEVNNIEQDLVRHQALFHQSLVSQQSLDDLKRRQAEAALQLRTAGERLALLEKGRITAHGQQIESVVVAPIDGYILERRVEMGDPVTPLSSYQEGTVLMRMADMADLIFRGSVDEIDVGRLVEGMPVVVRIGALPDARIPGVLSRISLKATKNDAAAMFPVDIVLTTPEGTVLRAGFSANAEIIIQERRDVLRIPERLVTFAGDSATVQVRLADGRVETRAIRTGLSDAINVEVLEGLAEGDDVVEPAVKEIK